MAEYSTSDFWRALYGEIGPGESIEIRAKLKDGMKRVHFQDIDKAGLGARILSKRGDVYFGVATRDRKGGRKGNLVRIPAAWADLDSTEDYFDPLLRLQDSPLWPSAIVCSGKGLHCYWFLDKAVGPDGVPAIEELNKLIARALGGDTVHDAARVLRVPETHNWKYGDPLDVFVMGLQPDRRYSIEHMCDKFGAVESPKSKVESREAPQRHQTIKPSNHQTDVPSLPCRRAIWAGVDEGARHNAAFQLAVDLKRDGLPEDPAIAALTSWNLRNRPPMDIAELESAVRGAYSGDYRGLGCEKKPMVDACAKDCPVQKAECRKSRVEEPEGKDRPLTPSATEGGQAAASDQPQSDDHSLQMESLLLSYRDMLTQELVEPEFLVEGLVPLGGLTLLTGEGGVAKSFVTNYLACCVGGGRDFLDRYETRQGPALILDLENSQATLIRRLRKVAKGLELAEDAPVTVVKIGLDAVRGLNIDSEKHLEIMRDVVRHVDAKLVVVDPLVALHSRDENDNVAMRSVMSKLSGLAREQNLAMVVVHHHRKRGMMNDGGQMIRGASDLRNAVDSHILLRRIDGDIILVEQDKRRDLPGLEKFRMEMADSEDGETTFFRYAGEAVEAAVKRAEARSMILDTLEELGTCKTGELLARGRAEGLNVRNTERCLKDLVASGNVIKHGRGSYSLSLQPQML